MPIPQKSLSAIQAAGAATHAADVALKAVAQAYADHVRQVLSLNPFDLNTDTLFDEWKTVARLSQGLEQIESELRKIHQAAQRLGQGTLPAVQATTPLGTAARPLATGTASGVALLEAIEATDVVAKRSAPTRTSPNKTPPAAASGRPALSPNTATLWKHLQTALNRKKFTAIKRTQVGVAAGLPTGSVAASFSKLLELGYLEENTTGGLKLALKP